MPIDEINTKVITEPLISVIVPVYNVAPYLDRCIKSIISQTYKNLEIILVDDGSTDESGVMCDHYAKLDDRIIVIHKVKGGASSARNAGLDHANGNYIGFVDSDDYIGKDMYNQLYHDLEESHADVACCGFYHHYEGQTLKNYNNSSIEAAKLEAQDEAKHIILAKEEEAGKEAVIITNQSESDIKESLRGSENNVDDAAEIIIETVL